MKKIAVIISFILCASVFFCVSVSATGEEARLYVKARGTAVTVTVKTNTAIGALQGAVKYDEDDFDYSAAAASAAISANNTIASSFQDGSGATKFVLVGAPLSGNTGEWATVTYYSNDENTPAGFSLSGVKAFDTAGASIAGVNTKIIMPGDVDNDKLVTVKDYVRLKKHFTPTATAISGEAENADVDMDGAYTALADIPQLRNDLLGY
ncbi:MAG: hypothetical protein J5662_06445 [Clostridia bacterium]|nr:hypothetical protein [Clostridia bacterium]